MPLEAQMISFVKALITINDLQFNSGFGILNLSKRGGILGSGLVINLYLN